jgi:hypothetical protein
MGASRKELTLPLQHNRKGNESLQTIQNGGSRDQQVAASQSRLCHRRKATRGRFNMA